MNRKYRKGTKLKYISDSDTWANNKFEYGRTYIVGPAKPYGYYGFEEFNRWAEFVGHFIESPENFKVDSIPKWKKFIEKGKVF